VRRALVLFAPNLPPELQIWGRWKDSAPGSSSTLVRVTWPLGPSAARRPAPASGASGGAARRRGNHPVPEPLLLGLRLVRELCSCGPGPRAPSEQCHFLSCDSGPLLLFVELGRLLSQNNVFEF
jgi:hypothetical protein